MLHLREHVRALDKTLADQRRLANRLSYLLYQYFPTANRLFAHVESLICLAFLERARSLVIRCDKKEPVRGNQTTPFFADDPL